MELYISIIIMQILYVIAKFVGTRNVFQKDLKRRILVANFANLIWLITTSIGIGAILDGNYFIILPFLIGITLGVIIEDKIRKIKWQMI